MVTIFMSLSALALMQSHVSHAMEIPERPLAASPKRYSQIDLMDAIKQVEDLNKSNPDVHLELTLATLKKAKLQTYESDAYKSVLEALRDLRELGSDLPKYTHIEEMLQGIADDYEIKSRSELFEKLINLLEDLKQRSRSSQKLQKALDDLALAKKELNTNNALRRLISALTHIMSVGNIGSQDLDPIKELVTDLVHRYKELALKMEVVKIEEPVKAVGKGEILIKPSKPAPITLKPAKQPMVSVALAAAISKAPAGIKPPPASLVKAPAGNEPISQEESELSPAAFLELISKAPAGFKPGALAQQLPELAPKQQPFKPSRKSVLVVPSSLAEIIGKAPAAVKPSALAAKK